MKQIESIHGICDVRMEQIVSRRYALTKPTSYERVGKFNSRSQFGIPLLIGSFICAKMRIFSSQNVSIVFWTVVATASPMRMKMGKSVSINNPLDNINRFIATGG